MDEQKRTKILGGLLLVVLAFMAIRPDKKLLEPIQEAQRKLINAAEDFEREDLERIKLLVAKENISRAQSASLPYSISDAQRLYQTWITNLAEQCKFSRLVVSPGNTSTVRGQFITVDVNLEAETDLEGLSRFLYLHDKANLMHRVVDLEVESSGAQNNPRMEVVLKAQGMSVFDSPDRSEVFPRTNIVESLSKDDTELSVTEDKGFPTKSEFYAQVGDEMIEVTKAEAGQWTVKRGVEGTEAETHPSGSVLQLFPIAPQKDDSFDQYTELLAGSPFVKPKPARVYRPRIAAVLDQTIEPGESVKMTARAEDINSDVGVPVFALEDAAEGMKIDAQSGELSWETTDSTAPAEYSGTVVLTQENNEELRVEKQFTITVKRPNEPPSLKAPEEAIVILGQDFELELSAEDADDDSLKFAFEGETPGGLAIDGATGRLTWSPEKTVTPNTYSVKIKVTDSGDLSDSKTVSLKVEDDHASLTRFTGSVALDGVASAYFRNLGTNARPVLKVGDRVVVSEINAELKEIANRHVLLADAAGIWKLSLGESLRDRQLIVPADPPPETKDEAADDNTSAANKTDDEEPLAEKPDADQPQPASPETTEVSGNSDSVDDSASTEPAEVKEESSSE